MKICAIILTKDEEKNIADCLKTLQWCDDAIVIDDYSSDRTRELAKKYGARVFVRHLGSNFSNQRNFGLEKANAEWILYVDSDERVSDVLEGEIMQRIFTLNNYHGYYVKRRDFMWGKKLEFGETANVRLVRLARKGSGIWKGTVHERWDVKGKIGQLHNPLLHYPHQTVKEFLEEINMYTDIRASELYKQSYGTYGVAILSYPLGKFLVNYLFKRGFLDGIQGLLVAILISFHSFLVRSKLWLLIKKR